MEYLNSGIYCIVNKVNGKRYIGQAVDLNKRWNLEHKLGRKSNTHLQRAINKYGIQNFEFIVLEYLPAKKEILINAEQKWLDFYFKNDNGHRLYNICPNAETVLGLKRQPHEGEITRKRSSKKVYQFDLDGKFIAEYTSAKEAGETTGINATHICHCRVGKRQSAGNFLWLSSNNEEIIRDAVKAYAAPIIRSDSISIIMLDKITLEKLQIFTSIREAELFLGIAGSNGKLRMVCDGKRKTAYGYKWSYAE